MIYTVDYLKNLLKGRKLVLICDLDETLVSCNQLGSYNVQYDSNVYEFFHLPYGNEVDYYCMKKRPHLNSFLSRMNEMFELHLMSTGDGEYVRKVIEIIDPEHEYFGDRIVSREEIFNNSNKSRTKLLMFPSGDMIISIDDRLDVWANNPSVVQIMPFAHFSLIEEMIENPSSRSKLSMKNKIKAHLMETETYNDDDNFLLTLQSVFEDIHKEFFENLDEIRSKDTNNVEIPDVRKIMEERRNNGILKDREISSLKNNFNTVSEEKLIICKLNEESESKSSQQVNYLENKLQTILKESKSYKICG